MSLTPAIVLAQHLYRSENAKTAHGLVRGSDRFRILAVVDPDWAGRDAGELLDGVQRGIPIVAGIAEAMQLGGEPPRHALVGIATHGGRFTEELRQYLLEAIRHGLGIVNGLHDYCANDPEIVAAAREQVVELIDLRRPKPKSELHFWSGAIAGIGIPRIAVLGTDCAIGKRTTARLLTAALNTAGVRTEMIYTGQTGWLQGGRYGFVLDSVANDFVSGELEHAIVQCAREIGPDLMLIEGQSGLRNPSGPCGAELLLSGGARGAILQHAPGRLCFDGCEAYGYRIPPVADEIKLIEMYGSRVLAVTLNGQGLTQDALAAERERLEAELGIPVIRPLEDGVEALVPVVRGFMAAR